MRSSCGTASSDAMGRHDSTIRLFVAVYPPESVRGEMLAALRRIDLPPHRTVPPEQVHLTLQFIGDREPGEVSAITESVRRSASGIDAFSLTPERLITLPQRGRPRLIAVETDAPPGLLELQGRLASRLARAPRARPGDRFRPHLTVCRFHRDVHAERLDVRVDLAPFEISVIRLMQSVLSPRGAQHTEISAVSLGSSG